jgi:hypothetical protein
MKLSEMNTVQLAAALCKMAKPVGDLMQDAELLRAIAQAGDGQETVGGKMGALASAAIPVLLEKHFDAVVLILSALTGKSEEQIRTQKGMETIRDVTEVMDMELLDFFASSASAARTESQA